VVKPILQLYPVIPAADEDEREALRPLGRNVERYQETLEGMTELVKAADELGFWGVSSIEHHFHSEGYEVGPSPGLLSANWAAITKRVRVGQLGFTMSAQHPIRVAEDTAIIDHLTRGRCFVGFSRGYQARWTNTLGQHLGTRATLSPRGASDEGRASLSPEKLAQLNSDDEINRRLFEEQIDIVLDAWTQDSIAHNSDTWQIPYPFVEGTEWDMHETSARFGAPGEIGPDDNVHRVSVVPAPYTQPHPPVFVAANATQETVEYCGRRGFIPTYFAPVSRAAKFGQAYVDQAASVGLDYALGQNQAMVRWMQIAETTEAARDAVLRYDAEIFKNLYLPLLPKGRIAFDERDPAQSVMDSGLWTAGSIEEVKQQFVEQYTLLPAEYMVLITHYAQEPKESVIRQMELFMEHVKPVLDEMTEYDRAPTPAVG